MAGQFSRSVLEPGSGLVVARTRRRPGLSSSGPVVVRATAPRVTSSGPGCSGAVRVTGCGSYLFLWRGPLPEQIPRATSSVSSAARGRSWVVALDVIETAWPVSGRSGLGARPLAGPFAPPAGATGGIPVDLAPATRVALLDGFALERSRGGATTAVNDLPRGAQRLIAHLSLCGRPGRSAIAGQLWPDVPEEHAHGSLRSALWGVGGGGWGGGGAGGGGAGVSGGGFGRGGGVRVDVREFPGWARRGLD